MRARHPGYEYESYEEFCVRAPGPIPQEVWIPDWTPGQVLPGAAESVNKEIEGKKPKKVRNKKKDAAGTRKKPVKVVKEDNVGEGRAKKEKKNKKTKPRKTTSKGTV